jgi:hypothetical protein
MTPEIKKIKDNCKKKEKILHELEVAIASLMNYYSPFDEEESCVLINGHVRFYQHPQIAKYKHGNWALRGGGCWIDMMDIKSVKFIPGHGV